MVAALLALAQPERVRAGSGVRLVPRAGQLGVGEQPGGDLAAAVLDVEQVEDAVDQLGVDALVEVLLGEVQPVAHRSGQGVEVVDVLRGGHFQRELGVFEREEARGAGHPGQFVTAGVDVLEQVVVDLRGALSAAHHGDAPLGLQLLLDREVAGVVHRVAADALAGGRQVGRGAGAEDQPWRAIGLPGGGADHVDRVPLVVADLGHGPPEADRGDAGGGPAAVVIELLAQRIEALPDVEGVQPARFLQVVEEAEGGGGVGERDQVGEERRLQGAAFQEHPGVPVEVRLALQEDAGQPVDRLGQTGQAQIERAEADRDEVGCLRRGQASLPAAGSARRARRGGPARRRCRRWWCGG